ncbi:uncharacterized protein E5676_scaffold562G00920 [Cucumis melo var. makuwa]|uniref:Retrotransposon gag domain-containing protein n=1 Tax=Cucumis melo var. makuwa TaxID=1194695 RepID=A0A5D3BKL9_CUCMM|nr:uncharacterized protein E5676_scaffold562G00920 [Cucumis melo var. makuwa]
MEHNHPMRCLLTYMNHEEKHRESMSNRFAQRLDKRFSIERLKALGATTYMGATNPVDTEKWLSIEKCLGVMDYLGERKDKFYPHSSCDKKRKEFMNLFQGDLTVTEYEKQFTEMVKYTLAFIIDEADKCK